MPAAATNVRPTDPVRKIMSTTLAVVDAGDSLQSVAQELIADEIGAVLVNINHGPVGLISERDLVAALADGDIENAQAADVMTGDLVAGAPGDSIAAVGRMMLDGGVRHVLVRDGDAVTGLVSIRDVLAVLLADGG